MGIKAAASGKQPAGLSPAEADVVRAQVAQAIRAHGDKHGWGSVPAGLLRWAEEMAEPPVIDWRDLIGARVRYHLDTRIGPVASYSRPSRRDHGGLSLPVHRNPRANITIVGDTSASMQNGDIAAIIGVVWSAVETLGTVRAFGCDTRAAEPVAVAHIDDLREALRGGGGTDMVAGIHRAAEDQPDAIVVVTDGETPWPDAPPDAPLVIVLTRPPSQFSPPPVWADVIDASDTANVTKEIRQP